MSERDELSMYIWHHLINTLCSIIEYPPSSNEDFEGNFILCVHIYSIIARERRYGPPSPKMSQLKKKIVAYVREKCPH